MRYILIAWLLMAHWGLGKAATDRSTGLILQLEESLTRKDDYVRQRESRIAQLRKRLDKVYSDFGIYQAYISLYEEYKSYKYDSAHVYAQRSLQLAERLDKPDFIVEAKCAITFCLLSAGLYREAFKELESIDIARATPDFRRTFYWMATRLNYDMADYNHSQPYLDQYIRQGSLYTDSLLGYLVPYSSDWLYAVGMRQMKEYRYDESVYTFKQLLKKPDLSIHTKAIITSCLGWISIGQNERDDAKSYLAQAAICDNESATKETTALCVLARMLYEDGDIERATRFVQSALDDANYYDARQRKIQIGDVLPIIEQDRYTVVKNERNAMMAAFVTAVLGFVIMLISTYIIRRQIKKLKEARITIEERNQALQKTNSQLCEANAIKDEYIGKSFYLNAEYINKVEKLYKTIDRKITTKQYEELRSSLKESELMEERKNMFEDFDETFLRLFPDFVIQYNQLFEEKDRKQPEKEKTLTNEMRIYALIRLGITDSERIANFLDYSVHTINTYKTRIKNKSVVDNEEFERRIMAI